MVHGDFHNAAGAKHDISGMQVVVSGQTGLTLKVGEGNFINIHPGGVDIVGLMVNINSGGAALSLDELSPLSPTGPAVADDADDAKPGSKIALEKRSAARKEKRHKEDKDKKSWIKIKMVDEEGNPVPGEAYRIVTPGNRVASGSLNKKGEAEVKGIDPGNCKVSFPNLDKDAWE